MNKISENAKFELLKTLSAIGISLLITLIVLFFISDMPLYAFRLLVTAPFTNIRYFGNVLETMVPLGFAGLATALLFRSGLFNLGSEGIFYFAGIVATVIATASIGIIFVHPILVILIAGVTGSLIACIPGFFKAKYDVNELVTSLMMNTILFGVGFYILKTYLNDPTITGIASHAFQTTALLPTLIPTTKVSIGFIILIITTLFIYYLMSKTKLGYKIKMTGINKKFAKYSGMNFFTLTIIVHLLSGFLAGMGSAIELTSMYDRFTWSALPGMGFDGALVAMLGRNHPIGAFFAAFGLSYLRIGASIMSRLTDVPVEMVAIVEASLVLLITADIILKKYRQKQIIKEGIKHV